MIKTITTIGFLLFFASGQIALAQTNKEKAIAKGVEAIKLMDNGKFDQSIKLLEEAQTLDPERFDYPYEMAYAYYSKEDYKGAVKILEKIKSHKDVSERLFQLLGNSYDILGNTTKAFEVYDEGLKKFPKSGIIYLEKGNVFWNKEKYGEALPYYEKGIEVDPAFSSNYYRATRIYCATTEEVWGMIYGEIFMNLERNSTRTAEISKLLFDTYKSEIKIANDSSFTVSFSQMATISPTDIKDPKNFKLPFGVGIYETNLLLSTILTKSIDINSLDRIRSNFVGFYFESGHDKKYPNVLFSYQKKVLDAGHMEAYNHWILMKGDEDGFDTWLAANKDKWENFVKWFGENGLKLSDQNKFHSSQY